MTSYNAPGNVQYNYAQLEGIWVQAGGSPGAAPIAAAIAMAESGGNTTATDQDSNGTVDRGLWQINSVHGAQSTYDVMGNARAAVAISNNGQNWGPWTTYGSGAYQRYLRTNVPPDTTAPINGTNAAANATLTGSVFGVPIPGAPDVGPGDLISPSWWFGHILNLPGGSTNIGGTIGKGIATGIQGIIISILNPFIQIAAGIMGIGAGGVLVALGIFMMVKNTEAGQETGKAIGFAGQTALSAIGPEATAATKYVSAEGKTTTVSQNRRPAGNVKFGGRSYQYRPARVQTTVQRPPSTKETINNEAHSYNGNGNGKKQPA